jgi:zinc transporter 2
MGSFFSNSIGVLTITAVLLTDLIKFIITIISIIISENPANEIMTYGYYRSEIISSLSSMLIVLVLSIWIFTNSIKQMTIPRHMNGKLMIAFSFMGIFFNFVVRYIKGLGPVPDVDEGKFLNNFNKEKELQNDLNTPLLECYYDIEDKDNYNNQFNLAKISRMKLNQLQRRELIHLLCDMFQCILVILASILIYYFDTTLHPYMKFLDDFCGFTFLIIMLIISWPIAIDCIDILMEAAPTDVDIKSLCEEIKRVPGVLNIHDIHLWSLSFGKPCLTMHILTNTPQKSLEGTIKICKKYGIKHCTIQVEDENEAKRLSVLKCDAPDHNNLFY